MITSNQPVGHWGEVFGDVVVATAILDQLLHHSQVATIKARATACARNARPACSAPGMPRPHQSRHEPGRLRSGYALLRPPGATTTQGVKSSVAKGGQYICRLKFKRGSLSEHLAGLAGSDRPPGPSVPVASNAGRSHPYAHGDMPP